MYGKMLIIQFQKIIEKRFERVSAAICITSIFLMATTKIFISIVEIAPKNFFSTANRIFLLNQKHFPNKNICMQNLFFFLHNVVLDTQNLDFFPFLWVIFFKLATNSHFFSMACLYMP